MTASERGRKVELRFRRDLGLLEITMIGLGPTIGTTIFLLVGPGIAIAGPALILVFVLNFIVSILTAMSYMELSSAFPETGGGYLWIKTAMKDPLGFLGGWLSWFGHSIVCSFYALGFGLGVVWFADNFYLLSSFSDTEREILTKALTVIIILIFIYINYRGTKSTGRSSNFVTVALITIVVTYIVFGAIWFFTSGQGDLGNLQPFLPTEGLGEGFLAIIMAMGFAFIVFEGYEIIAQTGEEAKDAKKNIPKACWLTLSIATTIFVFVALFTVLALGSTGDESHSTKAVAIAAGIFMPKIGLPLIVIGVVLGSLTALNSLVFSSSRVSFAMGRDGALPQAFGKLHKKNRTPYVAILSSGLLIIVMVLGLDIVRIAASADIMFLVLFVMVNGSVILLRKQKPTAKRFFKIPLFPLFPILGMAANGLLAVALFLYEPFAWGIAFIWIILGFGIHYLWAKREKIVEVAAPVISAILPPSEKAYKILVAQENLEDRSLADFASLVAKIENGDVRLLHVIEIPNTLPLDAIEPLYHLSVEREMGDLTHILREAGVDTGARAVISHRVEEAILDEIDEMKPELMILGWRGWGTVGRILGTTIDRLVQEAPCDIVVLKGAGMKERLERIIVMNAPAWHVTYATNYAIMLAKKHNAEIVLFSAVTTDKELETEQAYSARLARICETHSIRYREEFVKVKNIVDAVIEELQDYDLLVLGAGPEARLKEFVFGKVQDQIARRSPIPVLAVRKVLKPDQLTSQVQSIE